MKEQIITYLLTNNYINNYFNKVNIENRADLKQFVWEEILKILNDETKLKYLTKLWEEDINIVGKYFNKLISNQLKSDTSPYYLLYYNKKIVLKPDNTYFNEIDIPEENIDTKSIINKIIKILDNIYFVDAILYKLYRGIDPLSNKITKPKTYKEMEKLMNLNWQCIRDSIIKTEKIIKTIKLYE